MKKGYYYFLPIILQKLGCCIFFILYKIFAHLEVIGREKFIGLKGPIILSSNHTSELDATVIPQVLPFFSHLRPIYFVMNPVEKFKTFGWRSYIYGSGFLNLLGGCHIYSGHKDYAVSLENHLKLLKEGQTVCIFPEGKRTQDGLYNPARGGLGFLTYVSGATIVPIAINTFYKFSFWEFLLRRRHVTLRVGDPIKASEIISHYIKQPNPENFRRASQAILDKSREMMVRFNNIK